MNALRQLPRLAWATLRPHPGDPAKARLPEREITRHDVLVDADSYADYCHVTECRMTGTLPLAYPHLLGFDAAMRLFGDPRFPFAPAGLLHINDHIVQHSPIPTDARLAIGTRLDNLAEHRKGAVFDTVTEVRRDGQVVWTENSTYLVRSKRPREAASEPHSANTVELDSGDLEALWRVPAGTGRRYAQVSGDYNPVHLNRVTARVFGLKRAIAHGMWSLARCLGALAGRVPDSVRVDARFRSPLWLPSSRVEFRTRRDDGTWHFGLADNDHRRDYVSGSVNPNP
ncbi:MAG: MaoC family dehydratase [Stackebrandtia sp.]